LSHVSNVAHVEGGSGTFVLPVHSPYDRQMLREHVEILARRVSTLTLGLHGTRWTVTRRSSPESRCTTCTQSLGRLQLHRGDEAVASCIDCALQPGSNASEERGDS
jgi:hypothetical protein